MSTKQELEIPIYLIIYNAIALLPFPYALRLSGKGRCAKTPL